MKQIYEKRLNTINRYVKRGTLDADLAEVMKKLAKDKIASSAEQCRLWPKVITEKEMGQAAFEERSKNYGRNEEYVMAQKYDLTDIGNALSRLWTIL